MIKYHLMGDINARGDFKISMDKSLREILKTYGKGMIDSKPIKLVQVGGPLGPYYKGADLDLPLTHLNITNEAPQILYLNDHMCPVDLMRFNLRFLIREVRIDNERIRDMYRLIEDMANGRGDMNHLKRLKAFLVMDLETHGEYLLQKSIAYLLENFKGEILEHILHKKCKNGICRGLITAQCINACPAEINIPGYVELMKTGQYDLAYKLMRKNNPLSLICGKVCSRPCEDRCRRKEIENTVGVRALQRYASAMALKNENFKEEQLPINGKKVAIVGAGPGGLSAGYYLARTGYQVSIYESKDVVGGMLAYGVPKYRLPYESIKREVETIEKLGVKIFLNTTIGQDILLDDLKDKNDAVILSSGCHIGHRIPGFDSPKVETAVDFLKRVRLKDEISIGDSVAVIGGGDVAMDAARTAIRLGAKTVNVVSLESFEEMPASIEEKRESQEEGVHFINGYGSKAFKEDKGILKLELKKCLSVFDADYKFKPIFDASETKTLSLNNIILAIGQKPDLCYASNLEKNNRGFIQVDQNTYETSAKGIYAIGDMTGPSVAIEAIADGKKVAKQIDYVLGGNGLYLGEEISIPESVLNIRTWDDLLNLEEKLPIHKRQGSFKEVTKEYSEEISKLEASRCMRCDRNSTKELLLTPRRF